MAANTTAATMITSGGGNISINGGIFTFNVTSGDEGSNKQVHEGNTDTNDQAEELPSSPNPTLRPPPIATAVVSGDQVAQRPPSRGLLLSIDGGGIRGLSTLIILQEIMHRLKFKLKLQDPPKPCEIFDLAGGAGTGGLIVIMLFRLQMSVKEAREAYSRFMKSVFASQKRWFWQETAFRTSQLEEGITELLSKQLGSEKAKTEQMVDESDSKSFVCAIQSKNSSQPTLFRTWDGQQSHSNVTIFEAARATCTIPNLFKDAEVTDQEEKENFIDAGYRCNNPVKYVLREAENLGVKPSCVVSLGTGMESIIELPKHDAFQRALPNQLIQVFKNIAQDCERTAEETAREFRGKPDVYFRLNVDRGMEDISLAEWQKLSEVTTHAKQYLLGDEVSQKVDKLVNVLLHPPTSS